MWSKISWLTIHVSNKSCSQVADLRNKTFIFLSPSPVCDAIEQNKSLVGQPTYFEPGGHSYMKVTEVRLLMQQIKGLSVTIFL